MAPRVKTSIEGLTFASFYHMLVLSFFVTVELLPGHDSFKAIPIYMLLYLMASCFELFFVFVFTRNIPNREANAAFEFFGLMLGNMTMSCLMDAMIHWILLVIIFIIWDGIQTMLRQ
ncbi:hypothetical protein A2U01_0011174 [Trifolium medium]|uniref:Uncharacterized protein n=1 Tax=Trifolium medium TaxID=97028 RepID=A0A392MS33_9FABA|nr:hypothetical protein [Trifolium medium]